jgi:hypothetical protein
MDSEFRRANMDCGRQQQGQEWLVLYTSHENIPIWNLEIFIFIWGNYILNIYFRGVYKLNPEILKSNKLNYDISKSNKLNPLQYVTT